MVEVKWNKKDFEEYIEGDLLVGKEQTDEDGDNFFPGVDYPIKTDPVWRFWLLYEYSNIRWDLSDDEKANIKGEVMDWLYSNNRDAYDTIKALEVEKAA